MGREVTLLAAFTFALVAFILVGMMFGFWANGKHSEVSSAAVETVHLDYMHADWCGYCTQTKDEIEAVVEELSPHVNLIVWNEADRENSEQVRSLYEKYKQEELFGGFPTLVANGENMLVGKRSKAEIKSWVCSQFENKPEQCIE